jgi:MFS family permease
MTDPTPTTDQRWLTPGVRGIGAASFLADVGHEIPTALLPNLLTATLGAPAAALGLIEGIADGLAGATRLAGGAIADDPQRRRAQAVAGYTTTAVLSSLIGAATTVWQVAVLRAGAWAARGLRVPARNALLADIVRASAYGRAYGFERAMDNLGAIAGPLLAIALVGLVGVRTAIALSIIPGLLAALAIVYAIRHTPRAEQRERQPLRLRIRPVLTGRLGRLMVGVSAFEFGNVAATLLILRASELLAPGRSQDRATQLALGLYVAYNVAATVASIPAGRLGDRRGAVLVLTLGVVLFGLAMPASPPARLPSSPWPPGSSPPASPSAVWRRPSTPPSPPWRRWSCAGRRSGCWRRCKASATWPPAPAPACSGRPPRRGWRSATWSPGCCWPWLASWSPIASGVDHRPASTVRPLR